MYVCMYACMHVCMYIIRCKEIFFLQVMALSILRDKAVIWNHLRYLRVLRYASNGMAVYVCACVRLMRRDYVHVLTMVAIISVHTHVASWHATMRRHMQSVPLQTHARNATPHVHALNACLHTIVLKIPTHFEARAKRQVVLMA